MDGRGGRGAVLQFCASGRWDRIGVEVVVVMLLEYPMRWERVGVLIDSLGWGWSGSWMLRC